MKRLVEHLFTTDAPIFGNPSSSEYSLLFDAPLELIGDLFSLVAWPFKRRPKPQDRPMPPALSARRVPPPSPPAPKPTKCPADIIRELEQTWRAKRAAAERISDPDLRTRSIAMIDVAYRKGLAEFAESTEPQHTPPFPPEHTRARP